MGIVACPGCGAKNRVENRGPGVQAVCGRCGQPLPMAAGKPLDLTDATFSTALQDAGSTPVLVDCWAPWCGPCRALGPVIDRIAAEADGKFVIAKLNVDENQRVAGQFGVRSIPTLLIFKQGKLVEHLQGAQPKAVIDAAMARHL